VNSDRFLFSLQDKGGNIVSSSDNADATSGVIVCESLGGVNTGLSATFGAYTVLTLTLVIFPVVTVSIH